MKRLRTHMREPLGLPRWVLLVFYALFITLGVELAISGSRPLSLSAHASLLPYGLSIAGVGLSAWVSVLVPWHPSWECASALLLFALLFVYVIAAVGPWLAGDFDRGALAIIVTISSLVPLFRWIVLANRIVRKWTVK